MPSSTAPDPRTPDRQRAHYDVERELADRLRRASREERMRLYPAVYEELLRRVPDHPLLRRKASAAEMQRAAEFAVGLLKRFLRPGMTYLEVGPGDCAVAFSVAGTAARVYAVDVSETLTRRSDRPANVEVVISDGTSIPVPPGTVDLAFSNQLMEHLHPDDAREQLANVFSALAPGGHYVCFTPNRLSGPHDISVRFDAVATGLHLKEYTNAELARMLRDTGFSRVVAYAIVKGRSFALPIWMLAALEAGLSLLPRRLRRALADARPLSWVLGIQLAARKPGSAPHPSGRSGRAAGGRDPGVSCPKPATSSAP